MTGSEGYIGSVLVHRLENAGHRVVGLDACLFAEARFVDGPPDVALVRKDIRDVEPRDLRGFDAVVHLAALSNDPLGELDADLTFEINHRASVRLAEMAREAGVRRFLFSSSCSMYGAGGETELNEDAPFRPQTAYAESKVLAEADISQLACDTFSPVFMRSATAYGISPRQRFDLVLPNLAGWAFTTGEVRILSDGTPWRPLVHVTDISAAFLAALEAPAEAIHDQAFNVGRPGENHQVRDVAESVREAIPGSVVRYAGPVGTTALSGRRGPSASGDTRDYRVSFDKITRCLPGFSAQWTLPGGAVECRDTFRRIRLDRPTFESRLYTRVKQVRYLLDGGRLGADLRWR